MTNYHQFFENITDADQLYQQLVSLVNVPLQQEQEERKILQAEFDHKTAHILASFNECTAPEKIAADAILNEAKAKFETSAKAIMGRAQRALAREEKRLSKIQKATIAEFNRLTKQDQDVYEREVKPFRDEIEVKIAELVAKVESEIEPINKAYNDRAAQLGL